MGHSATESMVQGEVLPGWEPVREAFRNNFRAGLEIGAACAVYHQGEKVVDLWGGWRDPATRSPWKEDTLATVFSTTKGMSSLAVAVAHSRGLFDYDQKVAAYWPEFAQNGKQDVTVRQLLSHQAGLCAIDTPLDLAALGDPDRVAAALAAQKPAWQPGQHHGYHGISLGWYESELIRRVDPQHRTIGRYFADEVARPLGLEFYIGLPDSVSDERFALIQAPAYKLRMLLHLGKLPLHFVLGILNPRSLTARTFANPQVLGGVTSYNLREMRRIELPASNGTGQARSIAKAYGEFATGGRKLGIKPETLAALSRPTPAPPGGAMDLVMGVESVFSLGFSKPSKHFNYASASAFGTPGAGGSFGFADPELGLGFGYVMNRMGFYIHSDPREKALRDAALDCARRAQPTRGA